MLMLAPSHIARIVTAEPFNQALSRFRLWNAFLPPFLAVQKNSITQKDWQNFFYFALYIGTVQHIVARKSRGTVASGTSAACGPMTSMREMARNEARSGWDTCAVSVHMKFLHDAGVVESKTTTRTMTDLEGKPEEENSMSIKRKVVEDM
jgi:hypothetical protein